MHSHVHSYVLVQHLCFKQVYPLHNYSTSTHCFIMKFACMHEGKTSAAAYSQRCPQLCNISLCSLLPACDRCQHFNTSCLIHAMQHSKARAQSATGSFTTCCIPTCCIPNKATNMKSWSCRPADLDVSIRPIAYKIQLRTPCRDAIKHLATSSQASSRTQFSSSCKTEEMTTPMGFMSGEWRELHDQSDR